MSDLPPPHADDQSPTPWVRERWRDFRGLPGWVQTVAWILAWPALGAVWLWLRPEHTVPARVGAVALVVIMLPAWWSAPFGSEGEPAGESVAVGDRATPTPTPTETTAPLPTPPPAPTPTSDILTPPQPTPTPTPTPTPEPDPTTARDDPPRTSTSDEPDGIPDGAQRATVSKIVDGDTIWVSVKRGGGPLAAGAEHKIRLLEYDSPEATTKTECAGPEATAALRRLIPVGATVWLEADREDTDRYGRFLRYVHRSDGAFVNVVMVRRGWGEAVLYEPNDRHIDRMRRAEREARSADRGMWGMGCATDGSSSGGSTGSGSSDSGDSTGGSGGDCHPAYTPCVPPPEPDLDCGDVDGPITVDHRHGDPHRFDGDGDGTGCEG